MLKVVVIGYGEMFTNLIAATLDANCEIVGVLRKEIVKYNPLFRRIKDIINPSMEHNYIKSYKLPEILDIKSINSKKFKKKLIKLNPDIILVGSWGERFSKEIFNLPKIATINAHPSLLPKYRGPNPYFWVIHNRESKTGITFHLMDENYDSGAILAQEEIEILQNDTGESLKKKTVITARKVGFKLLQSLNEDVIIPLQQRENMASYYSYPDEKELQLDFNNSAEQIYSTIRAIHPWGNTWFYYKNTAFCPNYKSVMIKENSTSYKAAGTITNIEAEQKSIEVLCKNNKIIRLSNLSFYNKCDNPFIKNFINREISIGEII